MLNNIIKEEINNFISNNCLLKEAYYGELYHFTSLPNLWGILRCNAILPTYSHVERQDKRMENQKYNDYVCVTRNKNVNDGYGMSRSQNAVRITLNGEKISSSLRHGRIHPHSFSMKGEEPTKPTYNIGDKYCSNSEFEERIYSENGVYPFDKYCDSIDIFITDINNVDYKLERNTQYAYNYFEANLIEPTDKDINMWFIEHVMNDYPEFKDKIHVHYLEKKIKHSDDMFNNF